MKKPSYCRFHVQSILQRTLHGVAMTSLCLALVGCGGGPKPVQLPSFDPETAGTKAMEIYDTDGDGYVAGTELEKAPGLNAARKTLDINADVKISAEEVAKRVSEWERSKVGLMSFSCDITLDGKPLESGTITYEPEEFLGGAILPASGEIKYGAAVPIIPKEQRPDPNMLPGIQAGLYKVRISRVINGKESIPAKYNSETILGHEVSRDDPGILNKNVRFTLTTK